MIRFVQELLNPYGDRLIPAGSAGYGAEIGSQREDDLDRLALQEATKLAGIASKRKPVGYDIGCGRGTMAMKFAQAGCTVVACDIEPMPALAAFVRDNGAIPPVHTVEADARHVDWDAFPRPDIFYSQRFLHYLRFPEAAKLVRTLTGGERDCHVYLSMSGLHSELGTDYPGAALETRFSCLADKMAKKHGIAQKLCLYSLDDAERLAKSCDLEIVRLWLSEFGNVKLIAKR